MEILRALLTGGQGYSSSSTTTSIGSSTSIGSIGSSSSPIGSVLSIVNIVVEVLGLFFFLTIVGLVIIIVVANRADPDPTGRRPQSVYYFAVSFVTLVTTIVGSIVVIVSLIQLIGHHSGGVGNATARAVVLGGLITIASGVLLRIHLRRGLDLVGTEVTSPSRRVAQSYISAVAFLSILILLAVTIFAVYLIFVLAGPGVFGSLGGRTNAWRALLDVVYVGAVAAVVLQTHRNLVSPGLQFLRPIRDTHTPGAVPPLVQ
jgi:hypothetical protein